MIKFKKIILTITSFVVISFASITPASAETNDLKCPNSPTKTINQVSNYMTTIPYFTNEFCSNGYYGSHEQFAYQSLNILNNDKGDQAVSFYDKYKDVLLKYCDQPDIDEKTYAFAYHFYNPYTNKNYLPSFLSASKTTAMTKFHEHMTKAVDSYKTNEELSMQELGRAIHYLEDVNVPHHAANLIAIFTNHSKYESYVNENNSRYFINTSNAYDKYTNSNFYDYCTQLLDECAKNAYSYKDTASSNDKSQWDKAAYPTIKLAQENISSLLYRFESEVNK